MSERMTKEEVVEMKEELEGEAEEYIGAHLAYTKYIPQLEAEIALKADYIKRLEAESGAALRLKTRHLIQSINIIRGTMVKDRTHKEVFGGDVYLVDHSHMWALVRNSEELDALLTEDKDA